MKAAMLPSAILFTMCLNCTASSFAQSIPTEPPAPAKIDIEKVTCRDLLSANPLDRAAVVMFYWGYAAAKANVTSFKTGTLRAATERLITQCRAQPAQTLVDAVRTVDPKAF